MSVQVASPGSMGLGPERLNPEELVRQTRQVVQGLEALRAEHHSLAGHLAETLAGQGPAASVELLEEKQQVVNHSLEAIELGLGEAQVWGTSGGSCLGGQAQGCGGQVHGGLFGAGERL
jgi:kinesin light chain